MKILSLRYKLMSIGEREFDFSKHKFFLIRGRNYSGKTITLKLLTAEAIDKSFLFGNSDAGVFSEKTIIIEKDENKFRLYSKVTNSGVKCSFVINEGKDLTENGNLTSYNQLLVNYGLTNQMELIEQRSAYFFNLSPIDRKRYIQENYIHDHDTIEKWRNYVNDKCKSIGEKIKEIASFKLFNKRDELKTDMEKLTSLKGLFDSLNSQANILRDRVKTVVLEPISPVPPSAPDIVSQEIVTPEPDKFNEQNITGSNEMIAKAAAVIADYKAEIERLDEIERLKAIPKSKLESVIFPKASAERVSEYITVMRNVIQRKKLLSVVDKNAAEKILENALLESHGHEMALTTYRPLLKSFEDEFAKITAERDLFESNIKGFESGEKSCVNPDCVAEIKNKIVNLTIDIVSAGDSIAHKKGAIKDCENAIQAYGKEIDESKRVISLYEERESALKLEEEKLAKFALDDFAFGETTIEELEASIEKRRKNVESKNRNDLLEAKISGLSDTLKFGHDKITMQKLIEGREVYIADYKKIIAFLTAAEKFKADFRSFEEQNKIYSAYKDNLTALQTTEKNIEDLNFDSVKFDEVSAKLRQLDNYDNFETQLTAEHSKFLQLKEIMAVNGLARLLVQGELIKLEDSINANIAKYFTDDIKLEFDYSEKKLDIIISTLHSERNTFENLSNAEMSIVKAASSLSFQKGVMDIIRLDEIDAFFDESNRLGFLSFLEALGNESEQIFCISHNSELQTSDNFKIINL